MSNDAFLSWFDTGNETKTGTVCFRVLLNDQLRFVAVPYLLPPWPCLLEAILPPMCARWGWPGRSGGHSPQCEYWWRFVEAPSAIPVQGLCLPAWCWVGTVIRRWLCCLSQICTWSMTNTISEEIRRPLQGIERVRVQEQGLQLPSIQPVASKPSQPASQTARQPAASQPASKPAFLFRFQTQLSVQKTYFRLGNCILFIGYAISVHAESQLSVKTYFCKTTRFF